MFGVSGVKQFLVNARTVCAAPVLFFGVKTAAESQKAQDVFYCIQIHRGLSNSRKRITKFLMPFVLSQLFWRSVKNIVLKCSFIFFNLHLLQNLSKKLRGHFIKLKPLSKYHMTLSLCGAANHKKGRKRHKCYFRRRTQRTATPSMLM